jgi:prephenate dehydrogenase
VLDLAAAGYQARMNWEHRQFEPVELRASVDELCEHGRLGGWITAVLRDDASIAPGAAPIGELRLLGMRPCP